MGFPVGISSGISPFKEISFDETIKKANEKVFLNKMVK